MDNLAKAFEQTVVIGFFVKLLEECLYHLVILSHLLIIISVSLK